MTSYSITPALSAGLSLNATTGAISGTPTAFNPGTTYTITASNASGSTTTTVLITVSMATPGSFIYPQTTISATVGQAITPDTPTVTGTVSSYAITPTLPAGLSINTSTGTISGTPTASSAQTTYTVTASNPSGGATTFISITVNPTPPSNLSYPVSAISGIVGKSIGTWTPTVTGTVASYSVSPALPAGLSLNTVSGTYRELRQS